MFFLCPFFPSLLVVAVDVTVLAHSIGVEFIMGAVPRLLGSSVFVVAVAAHTLGVMFSIIVAAVIDFLSELLWDYIFFFEDLASFWWSDSSCFGSLSLCSRFSSFFERSWMLRCMYWLISCCCFVKSSTLVYLFRSSGRSFSICSASAWCLSTETGGSFMICSGLKTLDVVSSTGAGPNPKPVVRFCKLKLSTK